MKIRESDEWKTVFKTHYGHFEYQVMPIRVTNIPVAFQGYINKIWAEKLNIFVIMYLNDIFIYTENKRKEYMETVQWVLDQLQKYLLYAKLKKCRFYQKEVRFLGYIGFHQGIQIKEKQTKVACNWLEPQSIYNILVFLGFANFY